MIIVWRGAGGSFILLAIAFLVAANVLSDKFLGDDYSDHHIWPRALALVLCGATTFALGYWLNRRPGREVIDPASGQKTVLRRKHDCFFIPLEYWGIGLSVLGIVYGLWPR